MRNFRDSAGLDPGNFDVVLEFVRDAEGETLSPEDRLVHRRQPLVLLVETTLEAISAHYLTVSIIGFSRRSGELLIQERRRLESEDTKPALQEFLFTFEPISRLVRDSYGSGDRDDARRFFVDLFPDWLDKCRGWAGSEGLADLEGRVNQVRDAYAAVANSVVK
jgi:hypothetical protein